MTTYVIPLDAIHSQLEGFIAQVVRGDAFIAYDRSVFQAQLLEVVFGAESLSQFLDGIGFQMWLPFVSGQERAVVLKGILRDGIAHYVRFITDQLDYTPNFLLYDYKLVEDNVVVVAERDINLTPQHVKPLINW